MRVSEVRKELASERYFPLKFGAVLAGIYATLALMARNFPRTALALALFVHVFQVRVNLSGRDTFEPALLAFPMLVAVGLIYVLGRTLTMPPPQEEEESYWEAWE